MGPDLLLKPRKSFKSMTISKRQSKTKERLKEHRELAEKNREHARNESQTRQFLIDPFIRDVLGYDLANPNEVLMAADVGHDGAEKKVVDYAIQTRINGRPEHYILVEAKTVGHILGEKELDQLKDYVARAPFARFGFLTNGIEYKWYRCPPKKTILEDSPFLTHYALDAPSPATCKWLSAVRKDATDRDDQERLAWRLSLQNRIREWLTSTFDTPGNSAEINKIVGLGVPKKELDIVSKAASIVWRDLITSGVSKPPDPKPPRHVELIDRSDEEIDLGDDRPKLARAWRIGNGNWQVENNATRVVQSVLQKLLECDARRGHREQLVALPEIVSWDSAIAKGYKQIPGFTGLCFKAHRENPEKVTLLQEVSRKIDFQPPPDHPLSKQPTIEVWMPAGTSYSKGR